MPGGGAHWNKPTDDERFTWTLTADRHLVVTTRPAFILDNGDGTRSRTHDYGTPEEAGVINCVPLPATPTVTDPCGAGNASWNLPGDSAAITWRVEGNGHLIATTAAGTNFEDGTNSHDYGTAVETNVEPCPTPTPDPSAPGPVPTTPAPDPTTPAPTPSATVPTSDSGEVPPPAQLNRDLAHTGADTASLMGVAGVLIVAGIMALTRARRNIS